MKTLLLLTACVALSGCSSTGSSSEFTKAILEIAKDRACGHTDRVNVVLGPLASGSIFLERNCPAPVPALIPAP